MFGCAFPSLRMISRQQISSGSAGVSVTSSSVRVVEGEVERALVGQRDIQLALQGASIAAMLGAYFAIRHMPHK
jgi:hypothetical protein